MCSWVSVFDCRWRCISLQRVHYVWKKAIHATQLPFWRIGPGQIFLIRRLECISAGISQITFTINQIALALIFTAISFKTYMLHSKRGGIHTSMHHRAALLIEQQSELIYSIVWAECYTHPFLMNDTLKSRWRRIGCMLNWVYDCDDRSMSLFAMWNKTHFPFPIWLSTSASRHNLSEFSFLLSWLFKI